MTPRRKTKKRGFHAILEKLCAVLAISRGKSVALFVAASWTIMCQNLVWYSKLCQGKIKQAPKWLRTNCYSIPVRECFWKRCSVQVNPYLSKGIKLLLVAFGCQDTKMLLIWKVDLQRDGDKLCRGKEANFKTFILRAATSVWKTSRLRLSGAGFRAYLSFSLPNQLDVYVCVFWLCNVITALFNLSERDLAHYHNHHRSSQDSSYYFATGPTQRSQACVGCSETTSDPPSVLSWAVRNSTLAVFSPDSFRSQFPQQNCSSSKFLQTVVRCSVSWSVTREHDCYSIRGNWK